MQRFQASAISLSAAPSDISLRCLRCGRWTSHIERPLTLAELVQRADEHTEVCR